MEQKLAMSGAGGSGSSSSKELCLLSLDGGGVRGLSMLLILKRLMEGIDPINPPKPCDYFDMIGGTSTGGLIAIMLGRMKMSIEQCENAYEKLSPLVFTKLRHSMKWFGEPQGRFDHKALEKEIRKILVDQGMDAEELMKVSGSDDCKTFVCTTSANTGKTVVLSSYHNERRIADTWNKAKIWEVARATSAATTFFEPISFCNDTYLDGATGANNPVNVLWSEATDVWKLQDDQVQENIKCLISIGTGVPDLTPFKGSLLQVGKALKAIATQTEDTAEDFRKKHTSLFETKRAFRFNVLKGLEKIGLEEVSKWEDIAAATKNYIQTQEVHVAMTRCIENLQGREFLEQISVDILATVKEPILDLNSRGHPSREDLIWFRHTESFDKWEERGYGILWYQRDPESHIEDRGHLAASVGHHLADSSDCFAAHELGCISDKLSRAIYFQCEKSQDTDSGDTFYNARDVWRSLIYQVLLIGCKDWKAFRARLSSLISENKSILSIKSRDKVDSISELQLLFTEALRISRAPDLICIDNAHLIQDTTQGAFLQSLSQLVETQLPEKNIKILVLIAGYPSQIGNYLSDKPSINDKTEREECLQTFHFKEWKLRRDQVADAGEGTNDWIWTHPVYQEWDFSEYGFLWIEGKPGSGKSVLAKTLQKHLSQSETIGCSSSATHQHSGGENVNLGTKKTVVRSKMQFMVADWFFHRRGAESGTEYLQLFKSIIYQLLQQDEKLFDVIADDYRGFYTKSRREHCPERPKRRWSAYSCLKLLQKISTAGSPIICIIDAMDEANPSENERARDNYGRQLSVLSLFKNFGTSEFHNIKFIVLSRPDPAIEMDFQSLRRAPYCNAFKIILENENEKAIKLTIEKGLHCLRQTLHAYDSEEETFKQPNSRKYKGLDTSQPKPLASPETESLERIRTHLSSNAKGVILWVSLVLGELEKHAAGATSTFVELERMAKRVPFALDNIYDYIIEEVRKSLSPTDIPKTRTTLLLISGSATLNRPIRLLELREALAVPDNIEEALKAENDPIVENRPRAETWNGFRRVLRRLCGPLIEVVSSENSENGVEQVASGHDPDFGPEDIVQFMHQTVKDYLHSERSTRRSKPDDPFYFRFSERDATRKTIEIAQGYMAITFPPTRKKYGPISHEGADFSWKQNVESFVEYLESRALISFSLFVLASSRARLPETLGPYGSVYEQSGLYEHLGSDSTWDDMREFIGDELNLYPTNLTLDELQSHHESESLVAIHAPILGHAFRYACRNGYMSSAQSLMAICERYDRHTEDWKIPVIRTAALLASIEIGLSGSINHIMSRAGLGKGLRWTVEHRDSSSVSNPLTRLFGNGYEEIVRHPLIMLAIDSGHPEIVDRLSRLKFLVHDTDRYDLVDLPGQRNKGTQKSTRMSQAGDSIKSSLAPFAHSVQDELIPFDRAAYLHMQMMHLSDVKRMWIEEATNNRENKGSIDDECTDDTKDVLRWLTYHLDACYS